MGHAATQLCRLAFELANQPDPRSVANLALDGLFEGTQVDAGAVLLGFARRATSRPLRPTTWRWLPRGRRSASRTIASRTFSPSMVLRDGEAVLARNIAGDSSLGLRDSKGVFHATSVICAPDPAGNQRLWTGAPLLHRHRPRRSIPTIWNSRWPWPRTWRWRCGTSSGSRN